MTSSSEAGAQAPRRSPVMRTSPAMRRVRFTEVEPAPPTTPRPAAAVLSGLLDRDLAGAALRRAAAGAGVPASTAVRTAGALEAAEREARELGWNAGYAESRRTGHEAGWAEGRAEGVDAGLAEGRARLDGASAALEAAAAVLMEHARQLALVTEDRLAHAAFDLAEAVVRRTIDDDPERGRAAVARALGLAPEGGATVRLHPDDAALVPADGWGREVTIVADPAVSPGSCVAVVGATVVDARLEAALDRAREVLAR